MKENNIKVISWTIENIVEGEKTTKKIRWKSFRFFLFVLLIFSFIFSSVFFLKFFLSFSGRSAYEKWDFEKAFSKYEKLISLDKNEESLYNLWVSEYRLWEYEKAKELFQEALSFSWWLQKDILFNLGNTNFYLWESTDNEQEKIDFWETSLLSFEKSLLLKEEKQTRENYEYVKNLLEKEKKKQEDSQNNGEKSLKDEKEKTWEDDENHGKNENQKEENWENQDEEAKNEDNQAKAWEAEEESSQEANTSSSSSQRDEKYSLNEEDRLNTLSDSEKEYLEGYREFLERQQEKNQENFNNFSDGEGINRIFDNFFNDPFFENDFIEREKDW